MTPGVRGWGARLIREPLVIFFGLAIGFFALHGARAPAASDVIELDRSQIQAEQSARLGRRVTPEELEIALARAAEQIALEREAKRLGLHEGDPIIARRLVQKMEMLAEDLATLAPPSQSDLQQHLEAHPERYRQPVQRTVEHVYLRASPDAPARAQETLRRLGSAELPARLGDPFAAGRRFDARTEEDLARVLGAPVAAAAFGADVDVWVGPFESVYGLHLVRASDHVEPRLPPLEQIRSQVEADYERARRAEAIAAARARATARYRVEIR